MIILLWLKSYLNPRSFVTGDGEWCSYNCVSPHACKAYVVFWKYRTCNSVECQIRYFNSQCALDTIVVAHGVKCMCNVDVKDPFLSHSKNSWALSSNPDKVILEIGFSCEAFLNHTCWYIRLASQRALSDYHNIWLECSWYNGKPW